ncbi:MAG: GPW/gp25 family protein [Angelakisella sp.]|jgi:phage baseplate assembly protein W|nr:GPW/gp25 family protein [Angelakisella sp.]
MSYTVSATDLKAIHLNEKNTVDSVLQNIAVILSTPLGTVPLYRDFGLDWSFLDKPMPVAKVLMVAPVREAIERWEPRATVLDVSFSEDPSRPGVLIPTVEVDINIE